MKLTDSVDVTDRSARHGQGRRSVIRFTVHSGAATVLPKPRLP